MKTPSRTQSLLWLAALAALATACPSPSRADAINKARILRKAGGISGGGLKNVKFSEDGGPLQDSFNRIGKARIPTSKGPERTTVLHGPVPDPNFNTLTQGRVTRASVLRQGKLISYAGVGTNDYFDGFGLFSGNGTAQSRIRGTKAFTSGKVRGTRTNTNTTKDESAQGDVYGKSNY